MDRVYKAGIPRYLKEFESLRAELSGLRTKTDWVRLRVEPLIAHAEALNRLLRSARFAKETGRLRGGVVMFHADLVYLRTHIKVLKEILAKETRRVGRMSKAKR